MSISRDEKRILRQHFIVAEDYACGNLWCGWRTHVGDIFKHDEPEALLRQEDALREELGLRWSLGAPETSTVDEDSPIVLGLELCHTGSISPVDLSRVMQKRDALSERIRQSESVSRLFDLEAESSVYILAQGPLCNASLVLGATMANPSDLKPRGSLLGKPLRYVRASPGMVQESHPEGGVGGLLLGKAGPWRSPMIDEVLLDPKVVAKARKELESKGVKPARGHLVYSYGN